MASQVPGYHGVLLEVDLSNRRINEIDLNCGIDLSRSDITMFDAVNKFLDMKLKTMVTELEEKKHNS